MKLFADANENYLQAMKLIASKNIPEADRNLNEATAQYEAMQTGGLKTGKSIIISEIPIIAAANWEKRL